MQLVPQSKRRAASARRKAYALENAIWQEGLPQLDVPIRHFFAAGVYGREMTVPAGCVVVGKIHKYEQINVLSKGEVSVQTDEGVQHFSAPHTFIGTAGAKRVFHTHSEIVWTVFHATPETDVEKIEEIFIAKDEQTYLAFAKEQEVLLCLG